MCYTVMPDAITGGGGSLPNMTLLMLGYSLAEAPKSLAFLCSIFEPVLAVTN